MTGGAEREPTAAAAAPPPATASDPGAHQSRALPGVVEFVDGADVYWQVTERDARGDPGSRGDRCLIFASSEAVRRVWRYPAGWRELSATALAALSWQR